MLISETFTSIQGEGSLTGVPSWFCRLSGCNLRCTWCDTPYASWNPEGTQRTVNELLEDATASGAGHAVLTGGEPMIFANLVPLARGLKELGMHITVETAGTVWLDDLECDLISISPKLANSTPVSDPRDSGGTSGGKWNLLHEERRLNIPVLNTLLGAFPARQLKFVVASPADLPEIDDLLDHFTGLGTKLAPSEVFLMPEGVTAPSPESVAWVVEECTRRGWRYGHRLHIELFGDTRGT